MASQKIYAGAALRETRNRQILDGASDYAIIATDLEGRVTLWNAGAARLFGGGGAAATESAIAMRIIGIGGGGGTAIVTAGNFPVAVPSWYLVPALLCGNTVVWKPSPTQAYAAHITMRLLEEAGLPAGVINLVNGDGRAMSDVALADEVVNLHDGVPGRGGRRSTRAQRWRRPPAHLRRTGRHGSGCRATPRTDLHDAHPGHAG